MIKSLQRLYENLFIKFYEIFKSIVNLNDSTSWIILPLQTKRPYVIIPFSITRLNKINFLLPTKYGHYVGHEYTIKADYLDFRSRCYH